MSVELPKTKTVDKHFILPKPKQNLRNELEAIAGWQNITHHLSSLYTLLGLRLRDYCHEGCAKNILHKANKRHLQGASYLIELNEVLHKSVVESWSWVHTVPWRFLWLYFMYSVALSASLLWASNCTKSFGSMNLTWFSAQEAHSAGGSYMHTEIKIDNVDNDRVPRKATHWRDHCFPKVAGKGFLEVLSWASREREALPPMCRWWSIHTPGLGVPD